MDHVIIEQLRKEIEKFSPSTLPESVGRVVRSGDGVAEIEGMKDARMMEMVSFDRSGSSRGELSDTLSKTAPIYGLVLNLEEENVKAIILGNPFDVSEGMIVKSTGKLLSLPVSEDIVGRIVDPLGLPLDGKGMLKNPEYRPVERDAYGVILRAGVDTPLHTGLKAIDAMIPIGRGQRELIIGDRFTGKTTIAIDTILNQLSEPKESRPICIYVSIGQKEAKTARIAQLLSDRGAMEYTTIVSASSSAPAAIQFLAPFAGAAIGEYFMDKGRDVLVVYDDLSKHAVAYREISLLLRRPPGREAYPGDIFYLHSRLLERAAKLSKERGGGSLTALPIIETQEGDVSAYIPTNVISITDGQIFLDADLYNKGMKPAINVGLSVSRVGSAAQTKAMKKVAGTMRLELAQFRELEAFSQFAEDLDDATKKRIASGRRLSEVLKQDKHEPMPFERQAVLIFAATSAGFSRIPVARMKDAEKKFFAFLDARYADMLGIVRTERAISAETEEKLKGATKEFLDAHPEITEN
ncbi:MAG: F0F1 ATP synthase subunit alpha [Patescibacteria group bacterium]